jgi:hypothetical protein
MLTTSLTVPPFITEAHAGVVNSFLFRALFVLEANENFYLFVVFSPFLVVLYSFLLF